jgi:hypothetical protein
MAKHSRRFRKSRKHMKKRYSRKHRGGGNGNGSSVNGSYPIINTRIETAIRNKIKEIEQEIAKIETSGINTSSNTALKLHKLEEELKSLKALNK